MYVCVGEAISPSHTRVRIHDGLIYTCGDKIAYFMFVEGKQTSCYPKGPPFPLLNKTIRLRFIHPRRPTLTLGAKRSGVEYFCAAIYGRAESDSESRYVSTSTIENIIIIGTLIHRHRTCTAVVITPVKNAASVCILSYAVLRDVINLTLWQVEMYVHIKWSMSRNDG